MKRDLRKQEPKEAPKAEGWEQSWEKVNAELREGVNPNAYRLGFLAAKRIFNGTKEEPKTGESREELQDDFVMGFYFWMTTGSHDIPKEHIRNRIKQYREYLTRKQTEQ